MRIRSLFRGRIDRPVTGWISLVNLTNDVMWARPESGDGPTQSVLLQRLSEMMAAAIEPMTVAKTPVKRNVVKAPSKPVAPPAIPAVEPIRTDLEVFRF